MEIRKVKLIPKIRKVSEFDAPLDDVGAKISKDPTSIWEVSEAAPGLVHRFRARKAAGEFAGIAVKGVGKSIYFTAAEV
jgi:hypothetical protein